MNERVRTLDVGLIIAAVSAIAVGGGGCTDPATPAPPVVRKSASALSVDEIDRYRRAHEYAVAEGYFDVFNDEHYDHHRNRNHGADVLATSPMTVELMDEASGYRLLPWHRSFMLEAEAMLRAALRARDEAEGRDPAEADLLFIPYWDVSHDQGLPAWLDDLDLDGGTAIVPPGLPPGHAGYGLPVGSRYRIDFGRWPGRNDAFDRLPTPARIATIMGKHGFVDFYRALDADPEVVTVNYPAALAALDTLDRLLPDEPAVDTLQAAFAQPPGDSDPEEITATTNALLTLAHLEAVESRRAQPDAQLIDAVEDVYALFDFVPHLTMHLWAGGLAPDDASRRGTLTYFNELCVDPVFWMIHAELDRLWYTWEGQHGEAPPLTGELARFNPLTADEGAWYGGGKTYELDELLDHERLGYGYDQLYAP